MNSPLTISNTHGTMALTRGDKGEKNTSYTLNKNTVSVVFLRLNKVMKYL